MGVLEELHDEHKARQERIAKAAFKTVALPPKPLTITSEDLPFASFDIILNEICAYFGTRVEDILSSRRQADLAKKRAMLAYMTYLLTPLSNPQIAIKMNRDPTSIGYAINRVRNNLSMHTETIDILEAKIVPLLEEKTQRVKKRDR
jgi:chromosomal replication initiation ATPase DnaA